MGVSCAKTKVAAAVAISTVKTMFFMLRTIRRILVFVALSMSAATGCSTIHMERHEYSQLLMGVEVRIVNYAPDEAAAAAAAKAAFDRVGELEECMSDYLTDSELMRLCSQ